MKKKYRVKKTTEIDAIIKNKKRYGNSFFVIYYKENLQKNFRFAISIGKKYGNSVQRNKIKRQIRMIISNMDPKKIDFVIVVKKEASHLTFFEIKNNIENLYNRINETEIINEKL